MTAARRLRAARLAGAAVALLGALAGRAAAEDANSSGVLGLVHRLALRGDTAALERMLSGSTTGGVVDPTLRARILAELGRYDDAVAEYRRALEASPRDADALFGWADVELRRGHPEVARECMGEVWRGTAAPPLKAEAVRRQLALVAADASFDTVDWGAAIGSIDDPDLAWRLLDALVEAADREGELFQVEQATSRALGGAQLSLGPALVLTEIALRVGDLDRAAANVAELERGASARTGSVRALAGEVALERGQAAEAVRAFGEARTLMPGWTRMLEKRANAARVAGDARTAEADLRALAAEAIALDVRDRARATLVEVLLERQRFADAARVYVEAVAGRGPERRGASLDAFVARVADPARARPAVSGASVASAAMGELHRLAAELAARAGDEANTLRELELAIDVGAGGSRDPRAPRPRRAPGRPPRSRHRSLPRVVRARAAPRRAAHRLGGGATPVGPARAGARDRPHSESRAPRRPGRVGAHRHRARSRRLHPRGVRGTRPGAPVGTRSRLVHVRPRGVPRGPRGRGSPDRDARAAPRRRLGRCAVAAREGPRAAARRLHRARPPRGVERARRGARRRAVDGRSRRAAARRRVAARALERPRRGERLLRQGRGRLPR
ncbi:MAG: tetratricopeptide repeat protein [Deltaproteobacteria bacterium]|nr:tetratricopeptide repeat protein [Deltaproteobacteria bacterium]